MLREGRPLHDADDSLSPAYGWSPKGLPTFLQRSPAKSIGGGSERQTALSPLVLHGEGVETLPVQKGGSIKKRSTFTVSDMLGMRRSVLPHLSGSKVTHQTPIVSVEDEASPAPEASLIIEAQEAPEAPPGEDDDNGAGAVGRASTPPDSILFNDMVTARCDLADAMESESSCGSGRASEAFAAPAASMQALSPAADIAALATDSSGFVAAPSYAFSAGAGPVSAPEAASSTNYRHTSILVAPCAVTSPHGDAPPSLHDSVVPPSEAPAISTAASIASWAAATTAAPSASSGVTDALPSGAAPSTSEFRLAVSANPASVPRSARSMRSNWATPALPLSKATSEKSPNPRRRRSLNPLRRCSSMNSTERPPVLPLGARKASVWRWNGEEERPSGRRSSLSVQLVVIPRPI